MLKKLGDVNYRVKAAPKIENQRRLYKRSIVLHHDRLKWYFPRLDEDDLTWVDTVLQGTEQLPGISVQIPDNAESTDSSDDEPLDEIPNNDSDNENDNENTNNDNLAPLGGDVNDSNIMDSSSESNITHDLTDIPFANSDDLHNVNSNTRHTDTQNNTDSSTENNASSSASVSLPWASRKKIVPRLVKHAPKIKLIESEPVKRKRKLEIDLETTKRARQSDRPVSRRDHPTRARRTPVRYSDRC